MPTISLTCFNDCVVARVCNPSIDEICTCYACFVYLQVTLDAIGISMKALVHVMNLFLITFVIFTLAGVSLYQTSFQRRCILPQGAHLL